MDSIHVKPSQHQAVLSLFSASVGHAVKDPVLLRSRCCYQMRWAGTHLPVTAPSCYQIHVAPCRSSCVGVGSSGAQLYETFNIVQLLSVSLLIRGGPRAVPRRALKPFDFISPLHESPYPRHYRTITLLTPPNLSSAVHCTGRLTSSTKYPTMQQLCSQLQQQRCVAHAQSSRSRRCVHVRASVASEPGSPTAAAIPVP